MKKLSTLLLATVASSSFCAAQTLFTYGSKSVSTGEFVKAFDKNPSEGDRRKAMESYLPLYINYKLKVQDAYDKKMDTLPNQLNELESYQLQLQEGFVRQQSHTNALVKEAMERGKKDILLGHLFIGFNPTDSNSMASARQQANKAYAALKAGAGFDKAVADFSTDASAKANAGKVGWITVFTLPYRYENAVYALPKGGFSEPVKGSDGFHIFSNMDERSALGKVKVAQILLWIPQASTATEVAAKKVQADSLYTAISNGASFEQLALQYSNDRSSYAAGGVLPEFGVGQYYEAFEQNAFALAKPGDISRPFQTPYGWHILRLLEKRPAITNDSDPVSVGVLTNEVMNNDREQIKKQEFLASLFPAMKYKSFPVDKSILWSFTDSARRGRVDITSLKVNKRTPLFAFNKDTVVAGDWTAYASTVASGRLTATNANYPPVYDDFIMFSAERYYKTNVALLDPEFKAQMKEFKDANLLFEAMEKNVWAKAGNDTSGLRKYFDAHRTKYVWGDGAQALVLSVTDGNLAERLENELKANPSSWRELTKQHSDQLFADSGRYEAGQLPLQSGTTLKEGALISIPSSEGQTATTLIYVFAVVKGGDQRSFDEARGLVINDYQQLLEQQWISRLKKKYPVKINEANWQKLLAANTTR